MPPMQHIASLELVPGGAAAGVHGPVSESYMQQRNYILELIAKPIGSAGLVQAVRPQMRQVRSSV